MELTATDIWTRVLASARAGSPEPAYRTWLSGTSASTLTNNELLVEAPSQFHVEWIEDKYGALLAELTRRAIGRSLKLVFRSSRLQPPSVPAVELSPSKIGRASCRERAKLEQSAMTLERKRDEQERTI